MPQDRRGTSEVIRLFHRGIPSELKPKGKAVYTHAYSIIFFASIFFYFSACSNLGVHIGATVVSIEPPVEESISWIGSDDSACHELVEWRSQGSHPQLRSPSSAARTTLCPTPLYTSPQCVWRSQCSLWPGSQLGPGR